MPSRILDERGNIAAEPAFRIGAMLPPEPRWRPGLQTFLAHAGEDILPGVRTAVGPPLVRKYGYYDFKPAQWNKGIRPRNTP